MEKYVEFPSLIWKNLPRAFVLIEILDKPIKRTINEFDLMNLLKRIWNEQISWNLKFLKYHLSNSIESRFEKVKRKKKKERNRNVSEF